MSNPPRAQSSLPDKRTALYDNYVDLFFNRESAKSPVVREHRDLLIDIHRYLAWVLQSEAEQGTARGSISQERLQQILASYLSREEQPTNLAKELFTGMVERVVFIVSRVEGTFEFEVQPLREYFAARFLYETAPSSPPGKEQRGTKPDRFDALARNFLWTNVTRFYAGCFSQYLFATQEAQEIRSWQTCCKTVRLRKAIRARCQSTFPISPLANRLPERIAFSRGKGRRLG